MRRWIHEVNPEEPLPPTSKQSRRKSKSNNADTSAERILLITLLLNNLRRIHDNDFDVILEVVRKAVEDMNVTKEKKGFDRVMAEEGKMRTP